MTFSESRAGSSTAEHSAVQPRDGGSTPTPALHLVREIKKPQAEEFIRNNHYSGSSVWSSHSHYGVFLGEELVGVLQFGPMMNPRASARILPYLTPRQVVELNRMAFRAPHHPNLVTWSLARALAMLRKKRPDLRVVQSFADSRCKKFGAVYQAANFVYLGSHESLFYFLDGEWFHKSLWGRAPVDKRGWGSGPKAARLRAGRDRAEKHVFTQFRYALPLDKQTRADLRALSKPYPKAS